jgi:hypothetical protein
MDLVHKGEVCPHRFSFLFLKGTGGDRKKSIDTTLRTCCYCVPGREAGGNFEKQIMSIRL